MEEIKEEVQTFTLDGNVYRVDAKEGLVQLLDYISEVNNDAKQKQFDLDVARLAHENLVSKLKEMVEDVEPLEVTDA